MSEDEERKILYSLRHRRSKVDFLLDVSDFVCKRLEAGYSIDVQTIEVLRVAIEGARIQTLKDKL